MSQLKEIEGRYYQEAEVVMLATKQYHSDIEFDDTLQLVRHKGYANKNGQHLYIVSNEKIKESDWYIWLDNSQICRAETDIMIINQHLKNGHIKKIIATTNEYIGYTDIRVSPVKNFCIYPQPSDSFIKKYIEEYNKGNQITKVLVEYSKHLSEPLHKILKSSKPLTHSYSLKVDSNNTITIKRLEPELYTREQLENHIRNAMRFKGYISEYEVQEYCKKYLN